MKYLQTMTHRLDRTAGPILIVIAVIGLLLLTGSATPAPDQEESPAIDRAKKILRHIDDLWRGPSSYGILSMQVKTVHYTRNMRLEAWSKGKEKTLVRILEPLKEKGTATLKSDNSMYSYLPRTDRTVRLTSGMMMGSWMGSHFTNDDLVKESRMEEDYDPTITFEGERDGRKVIEFTLIPKPDSPVVWGKVVLLVQSEDDIPLNETYSERNSFTPRPMREGRS